jgi:hypothetical protein
MSLKSKTRFHHPIRERGFTGYRITYISSNFQYLALMKVYTDTSVIGGKFCRQTYFQHMPIALSPEGLG